MIGLSPRVRGNLREQPSRAPFRGSIPACAGEPTELSPIVIAVKVYPRVCGGTGLLQRPMREAKTLSPRVRGNRLCDHGVNRDRRSIPACAVEPNRTIKVNHPAGVYPRVCGGTPTTANSAVCRGGLSPRVRGNRIPVDAGTSTTGSIPACAGEPFLSRSACAASRVYPRVCGGTDPAGDNSKVMTGLSPRVRGNRDHVNQTIRCTRSIPACAGEPTGSYTYGTTISVYPRVCGGTMSRDGRHAHEPGLSPRVRGNRHALHGSAVGRGSIPACAGEPATASRGPARSWVYPRVCGGTTRSSYAMRSMGGLSPRVRGNRAVLYSGVHYAGSIPACAGEP